MKTSRLLLAAAALTTAAFAAQADDADASQYVNSVVPNASRVASTTTRTAVQADFAQYKKSGVNPWSTSYNPLASFKSSKTRAEVQGEYLANRDAINALNSEDSGSAYLAARQPVQGGTRFAAQPATVTGE